MKADPKMVRLLEKAGITHGQNNRMPSPPAICEEWWRQAEDLIKQKGKAQPKFGLGYNNPDAPGDEGKLSSTPAPREPEDKGRPMPEGDFYNNGMPFGLKNAGETYQHAMTCILGDPIHHTRVGEHEPTATPLPSHRALTPTLCPPVLINNTLPTVSQVTPRNLAPYQHHRS